MKERLLGSLVLGAITAAIVVIYDAKVNHAALAAAAARGHTTVMSSLMSGFAGVTLFVALVVFVLTSIVSAMRPQRRPYRGSTPPARRRERAGTRW